MVVVAQGGTIRMGPVALRGGSWLHQLGLDTLVLRFKRGSYSRTYIETKKMSFDDSLPWACLDGGR